MNISDWLMIAATVTGPIIAVRLTRYLDAKNEIHDRKFQIFKTLMATRAYSVSWQHVEALNRIDLEFSLKNPKEKDVIDAWKEYLDLLGNSAMPAEQWSVKRVDLLVVLLHKMACVFGYDFDKTHIKNSSYAPKIHGETEDQQTVLRKQLIEVLEGKKSIPMTISNWPSHS